jgi:hypothetical protein
MRFMREKGSDFGTLLAFWGGMGRGVGKNGVGCFSGDYVLDTGVMEFEGYWEMEWLDYLSI